MNNCSKELNEQEYRRLIRYLRKLKEAEQNEEATNNKADSDQPK
jgi:hypothetical protein